MISAIEEAGAKMWATGWRDEWFCNCESNIKRLCATVNGQLFEDLAKSINHSNTQSVDYFRQGIVHIVHSLFMRVLFFCVGAPFVNPHGTDDLDRLRSKLKSSNEKLLQTLTEVDHSLELLEQCRIDAELGRMSNLIDCFSADANVLLAPRFGIEQHKADGRVKVRPIDHFSWASVGRNKREQKAYSVNSAYDTTEKIVHETLDDLAHTMTRFHHVFGSSLGLYKADIDAAFRRIPIRPDDRWASGIAMKVQGKVVC